MKIVKRILTLLAITYAGMIIVLMFLENKLLFPAPSRTQGDWQPSWLEFEEARFHAEDGTQLHGWFVEHPNPRGTLLFFHGNGEHVAYLAQELAFLRDTYQFNVMAFDYRGYGKSLGSPSQNGLLQDGEAALDWLAKRTQQEPSEIFLYGRSLGGAVAIHVANTAGTRGLVIDRSFNSMVEVASRHFPWLPVPLLLRNRFPSEVWIQDYAGALFQVHGSPDEVIPLECGQALFEKCPSENKTFYLSPTLGHNDQWPATIYRQLENFWLPLIHE